MALRMASWSPALLTSSISTRSIRPSSCSRMSRARFMLRTCAAHAYMQGQSKPRHSLRASCCAPAQHICTCKHNKNLQHSLAIPHQRRSPYLTQCHLLRESAKIATTMCSMCLKYRASLCAQIREMGFMGPMGPQRVADGLLGSLRRGCRWQHSRACTNFS